MIREKHMGLVRSVSLFLLAITILVMPTPSASAISASDLQSIERNTPFFDPNDVVCSGGLAALTGSDNIEKAFNFFSNKGLSPTVAAAVVGNLDEESGVDPTKIQEPPDGPGGNTTDPTSLSPTQWPKAGWGIAQWTPAVKIIDIANSVHASGSVSDLSTQLTIVWAEMIGTSPVEKTNMAQGLQQQTDLAAAVEYFRANFEGGDKNNLRLTDAQNILQQHGASAITAGTSTTNCGVSGIGCAGGGGAGKFIDSTTTVFPGTAQACQRAQQLTNTSSALFQQWCQHTQALGTARGVLGCGSNACDFTAAFVWGYTNSGYGTALDHWAVMQKQGVAHPGDRNPPVGALLFYDNHLGTGHIAVYLGHNTLVSSDITSDGHYNAGYVGIVPAKDMEGVPFHVDYLGWSNPVFAGQKL